MAVYICGDTHIPHDIQKLHMLAFPEQRYLDKDDYVIIAGDFGLLWEHEEDKEEKWWKENLAGRNFTTLFLDGNHENFARLNALPEIDMFDGKVGVVCEGIYHLKRGYVYDIPDKYGETKKVFVFGGAMSTDKLWRTINIDWWEEEVQTKEEENFALENLDAVDWRVDIVITHAAPRQIVRAIKYVDEERFNCPVARFLDYINTKLTFDEWHFGHYHGDITIMEKYHLHYTEKPQKIA